MGADAFHVCYGVRREVLQSDSTTIQALERRVHPWQVASAKHGLDCWWGVTIDERTLFVVVGRMLGHFGWEGQADGCLSDADAAVMVAETAARLRNDGIHDPPNWPFQFEPDR